MKIGTITAIVVGGVILIASVGSYISAANYGNATEARLRGKWEDNENIYGQGAQKVVEVAQVPAMYRDDVTAVTKAAIEGRYGENGSQAVFQMLREQNPQLDAKMYSKIQQVIESFRDEFKNSQTALIDIRRSYETNLGSVWTGFWLGVAGYPKVDLSKYNIVTTDKAAETFRTKRDTGIVLRPTN